MVEHSTKDKKLLKLVDPDRVSVHFRKMVDEKVNEQINEYPGVKSVSVVRVFM